MPCMQMAPAASPGDSGGDMSNNSYVPASMAGGGSVSDKPLGLREGRLSKLLERLSRVTCTASPSSAIHGLGLDICSHICLWGCQHLGTCSDVAKPARPACP